MGVEKVPMIILLVFAFLAGIITVLSPCILPVLPIILSSSLTGGRRRPFGIVTGFIGSFTFFTLALASIVRATGISADSLRLLAVGMIGFFGISLLVPKTQVLLELLFTKLSAFLPRFANTTTGFAGGLIVGASLGLIWTPCVGPILASVITLALTGSTNLQAVLITLAYAIGTALPMLAITLGGRSILERFPSVQRNTGRIQKIFGMVMVLMAFAIFFNIDRRIQTAILTAFPDYGAGLTAIEDNDLVRRALDELGGKKPNKTKERGSSLPDLGEAPEFIPDARWLNSPPLSLRESLRGKVVLIDFWTYSCINCIRTLPYLRAWHQEYKDDGLVIVGVHAPEFEFEKKLENVERAVRDFELTYPIVLDNDFLLWRGYENRYWPAKYLLDAQGRIRYTHFGEGKYEETAAAIKALLEETNGPLRIDASASATVVGEEETGIFAARLTPEIYLGYERGAHYSDSMSRVEKDLDRVYRTTLPLAKDSVALTGAWLVDNERITSRSTTSTLLLRFHARTVHLVLSGSNADSTPVTLELDGRPYQIADSAASGNRLIVTQDRKYDIVRVAESSDHTLSLTIPPGISAYAFTFGR